MRNTKPDWHLLLFFANVVFVIVGYAINTYTGQAFLTPLKVFRMGLIAGALALLATYFTNHPSALKNYYQQSYLIIGTLIFSGIFFSHNISESLNKVVTFLFPFIYLSLLFAYLKSQYKLKEIGYHLSRIFQVTYIIPVLILIFLENGALGSTDISNSVQVFVKNHYGWATCVFLLASADLLTNYNLSSWHKLITYAVIPIALLILFASGSRSAWVSTILTVVILLWRWKNIGIFSKMALLSVVIFCVSYFLADPQSAFYARWDKTQVQMEGGEQASDRYVWAMDAYRSLQSNPSQFVTGRGLFDYEGLSNRGYHNSYFEILFGNGLIVFFMFVYLFVFKPLYYYLRYYSRYFLTFFPLLIIPFFESNLTAGQFLFYPWFSYMMFYSTHPIKRVQHERRLRALSTYLQKSPTAIKNLQ